MTKDEKTARAQKQAKAQLDSIIELVNALKEGGTVDGEELTAEDIEQRIAEDPLSVEVRSDWHMPGQDNEPSKFMILLCTGGPAVRIIGDLDDYQQPTTAQLEYQDWFTPWETYSLAEDEEQALLTYARQFYYGG